MRRETRMTLTVLSFVSLDDLTDGRHPGFKTTHLIFWVRRDGRWVNCHLPDLTPMPNFSRQYAFRGFDPQALVALDI